MTRVLQTRQVGLTTHQSGHVMAPPDIVYEVEEVAPRRQRTTLWQKVLGLSVLVGCIYVAVAAIVHMVWGITI